MSFSLTHSSLLLAQSSDEEVKSYIDKLEKGQTDEVKKALPDLAAKYQNQPGVIYLQGRLASNGIEAVKLYQSVVTNFPKSEWADEALYRIYQYYYAMGLYRTAEAKLQQLKRDYPNSPYAATTPGGELSSRKDSGSQIVRKQPPVDTSTSNEDREAPAVDTKPVSRIPPPSPAPVEKKGKYTLQVGAFTTAANAQKQKRFFENLGYSAEITNKVRGGKSLFVVLVGSFDSTNEAKVVARQVKSRYKISPMVVER
jgi:cell division septation protein DedD